MTTKTYHVNLPQLISNAINVLQFEEFSQQGWIKEDKVPVLDNQWYVSNGGPKKQRHLFSVVDLPGLLHLWLQVLMSQLTPLLHIPNRVERLVCVHVHF